MRLIDTDEIKLPNDLPYKASVRRVLLQAPTVDAVPVVHGRWMRVDIAGEDPYECSYCGDRVSVWGFRYCPNCGAKMDGDKYEDS